MTRLDLIASISPKRVAEIGVLEGCFSEELLTIPALEELVLVDPWKHYEGSYEADPANVDQAGQDDRYMRVCKRFQGDSRVKILRQESSVAALTMPTRRFSVVFIDAQHDKSSVWMDMFSWSFTTDYLAVHDYTERPESIEMGFGVVPAVNEFCDQIGWKVVNVTEEEWPTALLVRDE